MNLVSHRICEHYDVHSVSIIFECLDRGDVSIVLSLCLIIEDTDAALKRRSAIVLNQRRCALRNSSEISSTIFVEDIVAFVDVVRVDEALRRISYLNESVSTI